MPNVRSDPLRNFKFQVQINYITDDFKNSNRTNHLARLGFMSVSGLSASTEMIPYREGGMNTTTRKMPGQSDYPPVTFQRGLFKGQGHLFLWFKDIFLHDAAAGAVKKKADTDFRTTIAIRVLPHPTTRTAPDLTNTGGGADAVRQAGNKGAHLFILFNAWPTSIAWSDLDAGGNGIIMEQMTVVHEGILPIHADATVPTSTAKWGFFG
jgi:phage tail-like protein